MNKAVALTNRVNRFFGTNWKGIARKFESTAHDKSADQSANLNLSCVDTIEARLTIGTCLGHLSKIPAQRDSPLYWMDFGNAKNTGQVMLCTLREIPQKPSQKFHTVSVLPPFLSEFENLEVYQSNEPSCSLAQALGKQDLFINSSLANLGASLLWSMFREGITKYRGFYLNLRDFKTQPIKVG